MRYFNEDFLAFFIELAANNHKSWFDTNRKRYELSVREPFKRFVADLLDEAEKVSGSLDISPSGAIFRINRDIRFSKDKTPYKLHMGAALTPGGRRNWDSAGVYIQLDPEHFRIYSGLYKPTPGKVEQVRAKLAARKKQWFAIVENEAFKSEFGSVKGEKNKVLPRVFKEAAENNPYLYHKSWYVVKHMDPETILRDDLLRFCVDHFKLLKQFNDFLNEPIS